MARQKRLVFLFIHVVEYSNIMKLKTDGLRGGNG